jgi:hypothetical protein
MINQHSQQLCSGQPDLGISKVYAMGGPVRQNVIISFPIHSPPAPDEIESSELQSFKKHNRLCLGLLGSVADV